MTETQEELQERLKAMSPEQLQQWQKDNCPFCKIVKGEIPSTKIYEDKQVLAILDINPVATGHVLVLPKEHYPLLPIVPEEMSNHLFRSVKEISHCFLKSLAVRGTNIFIANGGIAGQQSQHFMVHIIPREDNDNISNFNFKTQKIDIAKQVELKKIFSQNLGIMLRDKLKAQGQETPTVSDEQVLQLIEQNSQLKEILLKDPEKLKQAVKQNPQLQAVFEGKNIDAIRKRIIDSNTEKSKEQEREEDSDTLASSSESQMPKSVGIKDQRSKDNSPSSQKQAITSEGADLDAITALLGGKTIKDLEPVNNHKRESNINEDSEDEDSEEYSSEDDSEAQDEEDNDDTDDEVEKHKDNNKGGANLDDIANLFK